MPNPVVTITENSNVLTADTQRTMLVLGCSSGGTAGQPYTLSTPGAAKTTLVSGKAAEFMVQLIRVSGQAHHFVNITPSVADATSAVTETPAGTGPTITISGDPLDDYSFAVKIIIGGARGTATFKYSLDGTNYLQALITTAATYVVPGTGVTLNFPNTSDYVADTVYTFTTTAGGFGASDVTTAINAARAAGLTFGGVVLLYEGTTTVSTTLALATGLESDLATLNSTYGRDVIGYVGCNVAATDSDIATAFDGWRSYRRICVFARNAYMVSGLNPGQYVLNRSSLWPGVMRACEYRFSQDIGSGQAPALRETSMRAPNGTTLATSEIDATTKLRPLGFTVLEKRNGLEGAYFSRGVTRAAADSLYSDLNVSRVISRAHEVLYAGLQKFVNHDVLLKSTGVLADAEMVAIREYLNDRAEEALTKTTPAHASKVVTTVSQSNVISSDRTLNVLQEVQIKGQLHTIAATLSATGTITITA